MRATALAFACSAIFGLLSVAHAQPTSTPAVTAPDRVKRCVRKPRGDADPEGQMKVTDLQVKGTFEHDETISVTATVSETTGYDNMAYPGITLLVEPSQQITLQPHTLYGIDGCGSITHTWTFKLPAYIAPGTTYRITAIAASGVTCKDPKTCPAHRRTLERVLTGPAKPSK